MMWCSRTCDECLPEKCGVAEQQTSSVKPSIFARILAMPKKCDFPSRLDSLHLQLLPHKQLDPVCELECVDL
jgi:hypothetical protein